jgi:hypothetical protein
MAARTNSSWAPRGPRNRSRSNLRMRLRCANRISIFLRGINERSGNVPGILVDVARDLARWCLWAALRLEWAYAAIAPAVTIQKRLVIVHRAARPELLSARAVVEIACRVILKVAAREGAIVSLRLVVHRLLLDQPVQHRSRPVGGIGREPLRLETEALRSLTMPDHRNYSSGCRTDVNRFSGWGLLAIVSRILHAIFQSKPEPRGISDARRTAIALAARRLFQNAFTQPAAGIGTRPSCSSNA